MIVCLYVHWFLMEMHLLSMSQESESEEDILDEGDDDLEEEHEQGTKTQVHPEAEPVVKKAPEVPAPPKEAERQLSKKERKQKELAELEALLADFGVAPKDNNGQADSQGIYYCTVLLYCIHLLVTFICGHLSTLTYLTGLETHVS